MGSFEEQIERMRRIFRGQEAYGAGMPSEQATAYRFDAMLPEIVRRARLNSATIGRPRVDLLVSLSGFSPATTILAYELLRPSRLFVISSDGADHSIDVIHDHVVGRGKLAARHFGHDICDGIDPLAIYKLVKDRVAPDRPGGQPLSAIIDITGGKKVMSAAAALVAWRLNLRLCYVDSTYDPELRQPVPGTERLLILDNPTTLFGEDEMEAASETFRSGAFGAAHERFATLAESISEPRRARFLRDLAGLYQAYSDVDLEHLPDWIERVRRGLDDPQIRVSSVAASQIRHQLGYLADLTGRGEFIRFLPSLFVLGQHYQELRRLDFAALLYYRTIEGCWQERFKLAYSGFDCALPDYGLLPMAEYELIIMVNGVRDRLRQHPIAALPNKVSFLDAATILHCLDDQLLRGMKVRDVRGVSHLAALAEARNKSLLAHGAQRVTVEQCNRLEREALAVLRILWRLHCPEEDIDRICEGLRFLKDV